MTAEGWYVDPFARHEARWFSDGTPTALVRDGTVESQEDPPEPAWDGPLEAILGDEEALAGGQDLLRVDDATRSRESAEDAVFDAFDATTHGD